MVSKRKVKIETQHQSQISLLTMTTYKLADFFRPNE